MLPGQAAEELEIACYSSLALRSWAATRQTILLTLVDTVLRRSRTVSGQFISLNRITPVHLDLRKTNRFRRTDREAPKPRTRVADRYYHDALRRSWVCGQTYVTATRYGKRNQWQNTRHAPRYLFFGAPNERSTAVPPRTSICTRQPFDAPYFKDDKIPTRSFPVHGDRRGGYQNSVLRCFTGSCEQASDIRSPFTNPKRRVSCEIS